MTDHWDRFFDGLGVTVALVILAAIVEYLRIIYVKAIGPNPQFFLKEAAVILAAVIVMYLIGYAINDLSSDVKEWWK